jgi:hypothetical protein
MFNKFFKYCFPFTRWADSALYKINTTVMPILMVGTIEFVHIEPYSRSALDKFYLLNITLRQLNLITTFIIDLSSIHYNMGERSSVAG